MQGYQAAGQRCAHARALMRMMAAAAALAVLTACGSTENSSSSATQSPAAPVQTSAPTDPASSPRVPVSTTPEAAVDVGLGTDDEADTAVPQSQSDGQSASLAESVPPRALPELPVGPAPDASPATLPDQPAAFPYGPIPIRAGSVCDPIGCVGPDGNEYLNPNTPPSVDGIPWGTTCDYVICTDYYGLVREDPRAPGGYLDPVANNTTCRGFICVPNEAPADPDPSAPTPAS